MVSVFVFYFVCDRLLCTNLVADLGMFRDFHFAVAALELQTQASALDGTRVLTLAQQLLYHGAILPDPSRIL